MYVYVCVYVCICMGCVYDAYICVCIYGICVYGVCVCVWCVCICMCVYMVCAYVGTYMGQKSIKSPGTGVTDDCELPELDALN